MTLVSSSHYYIFRSVYFVCSFSDERECRSFALLYLPVLVNIIPSPTVIPIAANDRISLECVCTAFSSSLLTATKAESEYQVFSTAPQIAGNPGMCSGQFFSFYIQRWSGWVINSSVSLFVFCSMTFMLFSGIVVLIYILVMGQ